MDDVAQTTTLHRNDGRRRTAHAELEAARKRQARRCSGWSTR